MLYPVCLKYKSQDKIRAWTDASIKSKQTGLIYQQVNTGLLRVEESALIHQWVDVEEVRFVSQSARVSKGFEITITAKVPLSIVLNDDLLQGRLQPWADIFIQNVYV